MPPLVWAICHGGSEAELCFLHPLQLWVIQFHQFTTLWENKFLWTSRCHLSLCVFQCWSHPLDCRGMRRKSNPLSVTLSGLHPGSRLLTAVSPPGTVSIFCWHFVSQPTCLEQCASSVCMGHFWGKFWRWGHLGKWDWEGGYYFYTFWKGGCYFYTFWKGGYYLYTFWKGGYYFYTFWSFLHSPASFSSLMTCCDLAHYG